MEHKDEQLKQLMKMTKREMPFDDFDDRVMARIEKLEDEKIALSNYRKYGLLFFVLGTVFGLALNYLLGEAIALLTIPEAGKKLLELGTQIMYVVLIVLFSDRILRLLKSSKKAAFSK